MVIVIGTLLGINTTDDELSRQIQNAVEIANENNEKIHRPSYWLYRLNGIGIGVHENEWDRTSGICIVTTFFSILGSGAKIKL